MARKTVRVCALCDTVIRDDFVVCREHLQDYRTYKDEEWFKVLVTAQRRQFEIDTEQSLLAEGIHKVTKPYVKLTESEKYAIRFYRNKGLGYRNIAKLLRINERTIQSYLYSLSKGKRTNI